MLYRLSLTAIFPDSNWLDRAVLYELCHGLSSVEWRNFMGFIKGCWGVFWLAIGRGV